MNKDTAFNDLMILEEGSPKGRPPWGITQSAYDSYAKKYRFSSQNVMRLTRSDALLFVYNEYWIPLRCPQLPDKLDFCVLQCAYNCGKYHGIVFLQKSLNISDDGIIGPETLSAAKHCDIEKTIVNYLKLQNNYYKAIENPSNEKWENGWHQRTIRTANLLGISLPTTSL